MEVIAGFFALVVMATFAHVVITVERAHRALDDFDRQSEREAEFLRDNRAEIEA